MFKGNIPDVPENTKIIYTRFCKKPPYEFNGFDIDFNDFPLDKKSEQLQIEKKALEEKISKIKELVKLKSQLKELETAKDVILDRLQVGEILDSRRQSLNVFINHIANLSKAVLHYSSKESDTVYNDLNDFYLTPDKGSIDYYVQNDELRCKKVEEYFDKLKPKK